MIGTQTPSMQLNSLPQSLGRLQASSCVHCAPGKQTEKPQPPCGASTLGTVAAGSDDGEHGHLLRSRAGRSVSNASTARDDLAAMQAALGGGVTAVGESSPWPGGSAMVRP